MSLSSVSLEAGLELNRLHRKGTRWEEPKENEGVTASHCEKCMTFEFPMCKGLVPTQGIKYRDHLDCVSSQLQVNEKLNSTRE